MPIMTSMTRYYNISRHTFRKVSVHIFSLALFSVFAFFTASCEKDILKIGTDLLPAEDFVSISSIDTMSVFSYTMYDNKIQSDNPAVTYLGQISDPVFGITTTEFVTQLRLDAKWTGGGHVTIDSVNMYLHLLSASGSINTPHKMKISEISDMLYPDSVYYSNKRPNLDGFSVDTLVLPPVLYGDTSVVIKLPKAFGERIFRDPSQLFYDPEHIHFTPGFPDFRSYFRGIYVQLMPSTDPILVSLLLSPPVANSTSHPSSTNFIAIFLTDSLGTKGEYDLVLDARAINGAYNIYSHNYLAAAPELRIKHINDNYKDDLSYLQYLNGVYTKIVLPGLEKLKTEGTLGRIAVNKARLVVPVHFTDSTKFISQTLPLQLVLRYKTNTGKYPVPDYSMGSAGADQSHIFFDGTLDSVARVYNFNIPQFVQLYLEDEVNLVQPELEIYQGSGTRNVIFEANKSKKPVKFEFTYTKF